MEWRKEILSKAWDHSASCCSTWHMFSRERKDAAKTLERKRDSHTNRTGHKQGNRGDPNGDLFPGLWLVLVAEDALHQHSLKKTRSGGQVGMHREKSKKLVEQHLTDWKKVDYWIEMMVGVIHNP